MTGVDRTPAPFLADWTTHSGMEPSLRVGIVLPEDAMTSIRVRAIGSDWLLDTAQPRVLGPAQEIEIRAVDGCVAASDVDATTVESVRIRPREELPLSRRTGLQLFDVVAGRGFHWQQRISPTFAGSFEFRAAGPHLLVVNLLPMEAYLAGVIAAEMSGDCPLEFLRSQCIVARSWVLARTEEKHAGLGIDRCNDDCCQRYQGTMDITPTVLEAVRTTRGQTITDDHARIIDANYSKSCGGIIEAPEHVWGVRKAGQRAALDAPKDSEARQFFPLHDGQLAEYLTGDWLAHTDIFCSPAVVPDADLPRYLGKVDDGGGHFRWRMSYTRQELEPVLQRKLFSAQSVDPLSTLTDLEVVARGESGRARQLRISYRDPNGQARTIDVHTEYNIRNVLHARFLYSSAFVIQMERDASGVPMKIELIGAGWGHGAGLCQIGALGMSLRGYPAEKILHHYFNPVSIHTSY